MVLEKEPFRGYTLDGEKKDPMESGKVFTVRLNAEEYRTLEADMKDWNIPGESTMLKLLADVGRNVLHGQLGRKKIRWLMRKDRVRIDE